MGRPRYQRLARLGSLSASRPRLCSGTNCAPVSAVLRHLGYAGQCLSVPNGSPCGTILRNATPQRLRELIDENLARLEVVFRFNIRHDIRLFRISSDVIPFGSHPVNAVPWWDEFGARLTALGNLARASGLRVSMHPGQYTVLSAPDPRVLDAACQDLVYHGRFLDALGVDASHKIVIHGGGAYGDKGAASARWVAAWRSLPEAVRARVVIENDERIYGVDDVLRIAADTGGCLPVLFDVFHHRVYGGDHTQLASVLRRVFATWDPRRDGVPKLHFSSQAQNQRPGAHAEYIDPNEFKEFLVRVPADVGPFDCMLEAKAKDLALMRLRAELCSAA